MLSDNASFRIKNLPYLRLCQPNGFLLQNRLNLNAFLFIAINSDLFVFLLLHKNLLF